MRVAESPTLLRLGTPTYFGKVVAVGWIGERYYWTLDKWGTISMIPSRLLELDAERRP